MLKVALHKLDFFGSPVFVNYWIFMGCSQSFPHSYFLMSEEGPLLCLRSPVCVARRHFRSRLSCLLGHRFWPYHQGRLGERVEDKQVPWWLALAFRVEGAVLGIFN